MELLTDMQRNTTKLVTDNQATTLVGANESMQKAMTKFYDLIAKRIDYVESCIPVAAPLAPVPVPSVLPSASFVAGSVVRLLRLKNPTYLAKAAKVISVPADGGRISVRVLPSGPDIRVLAENLEFPASSGMCGVPCSWRFPPTEL